MISANSELRQLLICVTGQSKSDIIRSLRIPLLMMLEKNNSYGQGRNGKNIIKTSLNYVLPSSKKIPNLVRGGVLFCLPHITASHLQNLLPVMRVAENRKLLSGIVIENSNQTILNEFVGRVPIITSRELISYLSLLERYKLLPNIVKIYKYVIRSIEKHKPYYASQLRKKFGCLISAISTSVQMQKAFMNLLPLWGPSVVVSTSDFWPFEYQLISQASQLGIPSAVIQHGVINDYWWPFIAGHYLLWGDRFLKNMSDLGAPEHRLDICGMPAADELFNKYNFENTKVKTKINDPPICLILSHTHGSWDMETRIKYEIFLKEVISCTPFIKWKVKLHPVEEDNFYLELGENILERIEILPKTVSLQDAVIDSDIVSTVYSTSGLEAMMMNRPLIIFDLSSKVREFAWWPDYGGGLYAKTALEFKEYLKHLVSDEKNWLSQIKNQIKFLEKTFANRGVASDAVVELLEKFVRDQSSAR